MPTGPKKVRRAPVARAKHVDGGSKIAPLDTQVTLCRISKCCPSVGGSGMLTAYRGVLAEFREGGPGDVGGCRFWRMSCRVGRRGGYQATLWSQISLH
jgi:hypothetical protein